MARSSRAVDSQSSPRTRFISRGTTTRCPSARTTPRRPFWAMPSPSCPTRGSRAMQRSEEHTSELQSRLHLVCRLLLEKKKKSKLTDDATREHRRDHNMKGCLHVGV